MNSVYISRHLSSNKIRIIKEILKKYNAIYTDNRNEANLVIEKILPFNITPNQPKTITARCLFLMDVDLINPFTYESHFNYLNNLFLRNKTFDFINCSENMIKQCTELIMSMDGTISKDNPSYFLTEIYSDEQKMNCVHVDWIFHLQYSDTYIYPNIYLANAQKNKHQEPKLAKKISEKHYMKYTIEFLQKAYDLKKKKKYSYARLKRELELLDPLNENLRKEDFEVFSDACRLGFARLRGMKLEKPLSRDIYSHYKSMSSFEINDKKFPSEQIRNSVLCGEIKHSGKWASSETSHLIYILNESFYTGTIFNKKGKIDWPYIASHVQGRNPRACQDKYLNLVKDGFIDDFEKAKKVEVVDKRMFNKFLRKAFTNEQENLIMQEIYRRIDNEELVTTKDI